MSNSFYHKDLTDAQWNRIKFLFEEKPKVGRPPLNSRTVFNTLKCYGVELGGKKILADKACARYDKLALCFENFVLLATCVIHF